MNAHEHICRRTLKPELKCFLECSNRDLTRVRRWGLAIALLTFSSCQGEQSALAPAGRGSEQIAELWWWMVSGATVIWLIVTGLLLYAIYGHPPENRRQAGMLIIGGGVVVPTVVLAVLLTFGLSLLPDLVAPAPNDALEIHVTGEQWWWRNHYTHFPSIGTAETTEPIAVANEIHLPVGEVVEFRLTSADVIHAFWIPALGGKVDMIPGRTNRLRLEPTRTGVFRGVCAEYCGASHALMAFVVVVEEKHEFEEWLRRQAMPAQTPISALAKRGRDVFQSYGCGACHTVRGTSADGVVGPDLTHVGGRQSLAAGTLVCEPSNLQRWLKHPDVIKPDVLMPAFDMLPNEDLEALAAYLDGLE